MKQIRLREGVYALVDDDVFESISKYSWLLLLPSGAHKPYAFRWIRLPNGKRTRSFMHREICKHDLPHTDHIDGNGLNNQRSNLRPATYSQNLANRKMQKNNSSGFKGVTWNKKIKRWIAQIKCGEQMHIGTFKDPVSAATAYDLFAIGIFGEFANTNFLNDKTKTIN